MKVLYAGELVDDFYGARVPIDLLLAKHVRASAEYLKAWDDPYTQHLRDAGIAPIAIGEQGATDALQGATLGKRNGILWCNQADLHAYPVDDPVGIIVCHDTGLYNSHVPEYFKAAEDVIRSRGRNFSGYIMRDPANACMAAGVRFDVIWATAALSWGGGPHPQSHVQQKPSSLFPGTNMSVDMGVVLRPINVWSATPPPPIAKPWPTPAQPLETDVANVLLAPTDSPARYFAEVNAAGAALWCEWTGDGADPNVQARIANQRAAGMTELACTTANLKNCTLLGPVPPGVDRATFAHVVGG